MALAQFWSRTLHGKKESWRLVPCADESGVPANAWKTFNKIFWEWKNDGKLYPLDEFEAYQEGCLAMIATADKTARGEIVLEKCSPATYVTAAGLVRLKQLVRQDVLPARERYRELHDLAPDVRAFVEELPDLHKVDATTARRLAKACIDATLEKCTLDTAFGLVALVEHDLDVTAAAKSLGKARKTCAWRRDHVWFPEFRAKCDWEWTR